MPVVRASWCRDHSLPIVFSSPSALLAVYTLYTAAGELINSSLRPGLRPPIQSRTPLSDLISLATTQANSASWFSLPNLLLTFPAIYGQRPSGNPQVAQIDCIVTSSSFAMSSNPWSPKRSVSASAAFQRLKYRSGSKSLERGRTVTRTPVTPEQSHSVKTSTTYVDDPYLKRFPHSSQTSPQ